MNGDLVLWHQGVLAAAAIVMIAAAGHDARRYRIPNGLNLALLALFPFHAATAQEQIVWSHSLIVFATVLAAGFLLYAQKLLGAGDVKFIAVAGLWAGVDLVGLFLTVTALAGGILAALVLAMAYYRHLKSKTHEQFTTGNKPIPYGIAIATGGLCVLMMLADPALLHRGG